MDYLLKNYFALVATPGSVDVVVHIIFMNSQMALVFLSPIRHVFSPSECPWSVFTGFT